MCRLFAQISALERPAAYGLMESECSLFEQSRHDRRHLQRDGWGIVCRRAGRWRLEKSERPLFREKAGFLRAARRAASRLVLAHVRQASNPRRLARRLLIQRRNVQPFVHGDFAFAHNGTLNIPEETARALGVARSLRGSNDSEVLFWLCLKLAGQRRGMKFAERWRAVFFDLKREIEGVWRALPRKKRRFRSPLSGLNLIVSDGRSLAALCSYEKAEGRSLCGQGRPYFEMCFRRSPGRLVVASEPLDRGSGWRRLPNGHCLTAETRAGNLRLRLKRLF